MKKLLLSLVAAGFAASMSAASYTVFDIANPGTWNGDGEGWTNTVTVGGKTFNLESKKADSTTALISPVANSFAWRVYKGSTVTITSSDVTMKQIVITYDDYESGKYIGEMTLSAGWTGSLAEAVYTVVNSGANTITMQAAEKQVRIKTIVVSDEQGTGGGGDTPVLPDGVIYQNTFEENLDGWVKINDESLSDFSGWKINTSATAPKCAICNSYYGGENHAANAKMEYTFNLTGYTDVNLSVEQAFGFDFPQQQVENYRLYVKSGSNTDYLTFANFPEAPESGNWTKTFAANEFDLSEYDGTTITIGFEYATDGSKSRAWELKNFILKGTNAGGVGSVAADENGAPVYYNLQGVRVANPENGLYIKVEGSKTTKMLVK